MSNDSPVSPPVPTPCAGLPVYVEWEHTTRTQHCAGCPDRCTCLPLPEPPCSPGRW